MENINTNDIQNTTEEKPKIGRYIVILIIIVILVVVGYFVVKDYQNRVSDISEPDLKELRTQGTSDEISEIEKDVNLSDFGELDKELEQIREELNI